jgi:hypothetical protein
LRRSTPAELQARARKAERVRKIRHLIYVPDFDAADRLAASLPRSSGAQM